MIKFIGCIVVIAASLWIGMLRAAELRRRPMVLIVLANALDKLKCDSCIRLMPMPDALRNASESSDLVRSFFLNVYNHFNSAVSFRAIWNQAVDRFFEISAEDRRALKNLGTHLGNSDASAQADAIEHCADILRSNAACARERANSGVRLSVVMSLAGGLLFAIILY